MPLGYSVRLSEQKYTVRAAQPTEAPAILDLWHGARSAHATTPDRIEDVHRLLAETPGSLLVADADGALVGAVIAAWDGWRGNMYRLVVLGEHRRRGVGLALVRAGEEQLRRRGACRITALSHTRTRSRRHSGSLRATRRTARSVAACATFREWWPHHDGSCIPFASRFRRLASRLQPSRPPNSREHGQTNSR